MRQLVPTVLPTYGGGGEAMVRCEVKLTASMGKAAKEGVPASSSCLGWVYETSCNPQGMHRHDWPRKYGRQGFITFRSKSWPLGGCGEADCRRMKEAGLHCLLARPVAAGALQYTNNRGGMKRGREGRGEFEREGGFILLASCKSMDQDCD